MQQLEPRTWFTRRDAAAYANVSKDTIDRAIKTGDLRSGGTAGKTLIRREWIDAWLEGDGGAS